MQRHMGISGNDHICRNFHCFVLMPFKDEFSFVYNAIKDALEQLKDDLNESHMINLKYNRADSIISVNDNKTYEILDEIKECDLIIVDISEFRPNIMWEIGYCIALGKKILAITQSNEKNPFYLNKKDVLKYGFSVKGVSELKTELMDNIKKQLPIILDYTSKLRFDENINKNLEDVYRILLSIPNDSLLKVFVLNEMHQLASSLNSLQKRAFSIRKNIPNSDIISYFSDYLKQIDGTNLSGFKTISCLDFWYEITNEGCDNKYLDANIAAIMGNESKIERIFIVPKDINKMFNEGRAKNLESGDKLKDIIKTYHDKTKDYPKNIFTRVFFSNNYDIDKNYYNNFGLLVRRDESLLMEPIYETTSLSYNKNFPRKLLKTDCTYYKEENNNSEIFAMNRNRIKDFEKKFDQLWNKGSDFSELYNSIIKDSY
jgi:nucleoside 2-deoxyribosyltransferase